MTCTKSEQVLLTYFKTLSTRMLLSQVYTDIHSKTICEGYMEKIGVYIRNISGDIDMNVVKREQIMLPNNEYLKYWQNYFHVYAQYIDTCV